VEILQWLAFIFGAVSAGFWAAAAYKPITKKRFADRKLMDDFSDIIDPLNVQSKLNGWGAAFAAISILLQAIVFFVRG
jgi:hypothetical protein